MIFIEILQCDVLLVPFRPFFTLLFLLKYCIAVSPPIFHPKTLLAELTDCLVIASLDYTVDIDQADIAELFPPSLLAIATISAVISRNYNSKNRESAKTSLRLLLCFLINITFFQHNVQRTS